MTAAPSLATRDTLVAAWRAHASYTGHHVALLNPASLAGMALAQHDDPIEARDHLAMALDYLQAVIAEEGR